MPLTPIDEALATVLEAFHPLAPIRLPLEDALHRYAAEPLAARADVPGFDHSAMDGYAVRASDLTDATAERPAALAVTGESRAGGAPPPAVALGQAVRIFTGAPVPEGADTVVMQEDTDQGRRVVHITRHPGSGSNIRRRGEDLRAGAPLLEASQRLGAGEIGLLASQGIAAVRVHRRPQVAILSTGDELRDVSGPLEPGTIVDSNSYALSAQVTEAGGEPQVLARAGDRVDVLSERVRQGLRADVLLTVGGVSVGDYDLVHDALRQAGVEPRLWKVAMKPGKPLTFGVAGPVPVVGLPGNPVSAMVTFEAFVRPGLRRMLGDPRPHRPSARVRLQTAFSHRTGRTELVRATLEERDGELWAQPKPRQGSGSLTSMTTLDALLVVPADRERIAAGDSLHAVLCGFPTGRREPIVAAG